jgi:hypothetical protein
MSSSPYDNPDWVRVEISVQAATLGGLRHCLQRLAEKVEQAAAQGMDAFSKCWTSGSGGSGDEPCLAYSVRVTTPTRSKVEHLERELQIAREQLSAEEGSQCDTTA